MNLKGEMANFKHQSPNTLQIPITKIQNNLSCLSGTNENPLHHFASFGNLVIEVYLERVIWALEFLHHGVYQIGPSTLLRAGEFKVYTI